MCIYKQFKEKKNYTEYVFQCVSNPWVHKSLNFKLEKQIHLDAEEVLFTFDSSQVIQISVKIIVRCSISLSWKAV